MKFLSSACVKIKTLCWIHTVPSSSCKFCVSRFGKSCRFGKICVLSFGKVRFLCREGVELTPRPCDPATVVSRVWKGLSCHVHSQNLLRRLGHVLSKMYFIPRAYWKGLRELRNFCLINVVPANVVSQIYRSSLGGLWKRLSLALLE